MCNSFNASSPEYWRIIKKRVSWNQNNIISGTLLSTELMVSKTGRSTPLKYMIFTDNYRIDIMVPCTQFR